MMNSECLNYDFMVQAVEVAPIGTVFIDSEGSIIKINPAACVILGYEAEECLYHPYYHWIYPEDVNKDRERLEKLVSGKALSLQMEKRLLHKQGDIKWVSCRLSMAHSRDGRTLGYIAHFTDITDLKRAAHQEEERLIQSDKLSMAGQLAAGIAHEIRNPMTSIKGFVQLIRSGAGRKDQYFDIISSEIERIELIVSELLFLAKPQSVKFERTDIRQLLEQVITLLNTQAIIHNVEIITDFGAHEASVDCDVNHLKQVFINFIKNAVESMPDGGELTIRLGRGEGHTIAIHFIDNGCGIPESILSRLGEPFFTTKEKGNGLGFMISKKMIEDHKGEVHVSSKLQVGTTITVILPMA
ncbi:ATP-binding protein [Paenibacillus sp. Cedars]|uniref:ATP-binding protein n=1 Tax=Paenibacillus sp. Cedars TaxID=1980674 RepID=UPI001162E395|nr:ATP-binding protein [Paenibacillus sp. Cedars]AWP25675.1 PAS domain-containing sensor histidine kinase [Paenibacillus sp. Cedars]